MGFGFKPLYHFRAVPVARREPGEGDESRIVAVEEGKPTYSQKAASVVLGAQMAKIRQLQQDNVIESEVPENDFTESELRSIHEEIAELRAKGVIDE